MQADDRVVVRLPCAEFVPLPPSRPDVAALEPVSPSREAEKALPVPVLSTPLRMHPRPCAVVRASSDAQERGAPGLSSFCGNGFRAAAATATHALSPGLRATLVSAKNPEEPPSKPSTQLADRPPKGMLLRRKARSVASPTSPPFSPGLGKRPKREDETAQLWAWSETEKAGWRQEDRPSPDALQPPQAWAAARSSAVVNGREELRPETSENAEEQPRSRKLVCCSGCWEARQTRAEDRLDDTSL